MAQKNTCKKIRQTDQWKRIETTEISPFTHKQLNKLKLITSNNNKNKSVSYATSDGKIASMYAQVWHRARLLNLIQKSSHNGSNLQPNIIKSIIKKRTLGENSVWHWRKQRFLGKEWLSSRKSKRQQKLVRIWGKRHINPPLVGMETKGTILEYNRILRDMQIWRSHPTLGNLPKGNEMSRRKDYIHSPARSSSGQNS